MLALVFGSVTVPDAVTFAIAAAIVVIGALGVVVMSNPVHCALSLVMTLFGVAVLFVEEDAQFLAAVQVIVYSGAIVVMFLFVIMLLGVDRKDVIVADTFKGQRFVAFLLGVLALIEVIVLGSGHWATGGHGLSSPTTTASSNVVQLGQSIFTTYLLPFEVTSALLVVAVIAAVVLARRSEPSEVAPDDSQPSKPDDPTAAPNGDSSSPVAEEVQSR